MLLSNLRCRRIVKYDCSVLTTPDASFLFECQVVMRGANESTVWLRGFVAIPYRSFFSDILYCSHSESCYVSSVPNPDKKEKSQ